MQPESRKLGIMLVATGAITQAHLQDALLRQRASGERLGSALVRRGFITEACLLALLARQTGVPQVDVKSLEIPAAALRRIPRRLAEQLTILPVSIQARSLQLAMADPGNLTAIDSACFASGMNIEPAVACHAALKEAIDHHYSWLDSSADAAAPSRAAIPLAGPEAPVPPAPALASEWQALPAARDCGRPSPTKDPFYDPPAAESVSRPYADRAPALLPLLQEAPPALPAIIHNRADPPTPSRSLETDRFGAMLLNLVQILNQRGVLNQDELHTLLAHLTKAAAR